jgi:hypothetical protein
MALESFEPLTVTPGPAIPETMFVARTEGWDAPVYAARLIIPSASSTESADDYINRDPVDGAIRIPISRFQLEGHDGQEIPLARHEQKWLTIHEEPVIGPDERAGMFGDLLPEGSEREYMEPQFASGERFRSPTENVDAAASLRTLGLRIDHQKRILAGEIELADVGEKSNGIYDPSMVVALAIIANGKAGSSRYLHELRLGVQERLMSSSVEADLQNVDSAVEVS